MKRPIPVILSAILLGLLAALELLGALGGAAMGFLVLRKGLPVPPAQTFLPPSFLPLVFFGMSLFSAALAVWSIVTLIGLVRLQSWARYSVLVIAGCMAVFSAIGAVSTLAMPYFMPAAATQPAPDPHVIRVIFFFIAAINGIFTAIGVALLVYFNLARTRAIFLQDASVNLAPANTSTGRTRPTAITVISWLYLLSSPWCIPYAFLPFPAFLFGFVFHGMASHILYIAYGVMAFSIGYGLFRLRNEARIAVFVFCGAGLLHVLVLLTPWGSRQLRLYLDALAPHMDAASHAPQNFALSTGAILYFSLIGVAVNLVVLLLLHRHRAAFMPAPPPPPQLPFYPERAAL